MQLDSPPPSPFARRPTPPTPLAKRRRTFSAPSTADHPMHDTPALNFQSLPIDAIKLIIRHLSCDFPPSTARPTPIPCLRLHYPLRILCRLFRDAFDAHVTALDLSDLPTARLRPFLDRALPRFACLTSLALPAPALHPHLLPQWTAFFAASRLRLHRLTFVAPPADAAHTALPDLFARACASSLERLSTTSMPLLDCLSRYCASVHTLELLMDDVNPDVLPTFKALRFLNLLYRAPLPAPAADRLAAALQRCGRCLHTVELRLSRVPTALLAVAPLVPRLRKVSLFDGVAEDGAGVEALARCAFLEEVQLEWIKGLRDAHVRCLAEGMRGRLRKLRIWNCEEITDEGLAVLAQQCPAVEVELKFEREQFGARALALFGDRVSWGSYAM